MRQNAPDFICRTVGNLLRLLNSAIQKLDHIAIPASRLATRPKAVSFKKHHIRYALRNALPTIIILVPGAYLAARMRGGAKTADDFLYGGTTLALLCVGIIVYWLWRSRRELPLDTK